MKTHTQMTPEQLYSLVRAEVALDALNEWADKLNAGSEELLQIVHKKINALEQKISRMRQKACLRCGNKSYLRDDECPYCGMTN